MTSIRDIDLRLSDLDDDQLIIALKQLGYSWLVTNNYRMLQNPRELAAILKTNLSVFAIEGLGHDPLRATGALLLDLPAALKRFQEDKPQAFWLRPRDPHPSDPWDLFKQAAQRHNRNFNDLYEEVKVTDQEFGEDVLE